MFCITKNILEFCMPEENETDIIIPEGVIAIKPNAFDFEDNITSITFPKSVCAIGPNAVKYCNNLKEIIILGDDVSISDTAIYRCDNLKTIKIYGNNCDFHRMGLWMLTIDMIISPNISLKKYDDLIQVYAYKGYFRNKELYTNEEVRKDYENISFGLLLFIIQESLDKDDDEVVGYLLETNNLDNTYIYHYIDIANERKALKCLSVLLDYKHKKLNTENIDIKYSLE